jgi:hypothetical protein
MGFSFEDERQQQKDPSRMREVCALAETWASALSANNQPVHVV